MSSTAPTYSVAEIFNCHFQSKYFACLSAAEEAINGFDNESGYAFRINGTSKIMGTVITQPDYCCKKIRVVAHINVPLHGI